MLLGFGALLLSACTVSRAKLLEYKFRSPALPQVPAVSAPAIGSARLYYTGCGGFLLEYAGDRLMVDPFFSYMGVRQAATQKIRNDTALINAFFRERLGQARDSAAMIRTVLIAHAHHDHLADLPALLRNNLDTSAVTVYGSRTMVNLMRSFPGLLPDTARQLVNLEKSFTLMSTLPAVKNQPEYSAFFYTPMRRIRFTAIPSDHAGHYRFIMPHKLPFTKGHVNQPLKTPPAYALNYKEGQNFNFLIDLLDEQGKPVYRIFSNAGAACDAGVGFPPASLLAEKAVDLLLICGANYNIAKNYPIPLINYLHPRALLVMHWENFFKPVPQLRRRPEVVPNTNIPKLLKALEMFAQKNQFPRYIFLEEPQSRAIKLDF